MFWGLVVQPNKKYSKTVSTPFHVSQAVLDVTNTPGDSDVQLILKSDKVDYILCILNKSGTLQVPLNLIFSEGDEISFRSVGGTVHLTGYLVDEQNFPEGDEDESSDGEEDVSQVRAAKPKGKRQTAQESSSEQEDSDGSDVEAGSDDEEDGEEQVDDESDDGDEQDSEDEQPPQKIPKTNGMPNGVSKREDKSKDKSKDGKHKKPQLQPQQNVGAEEPKKQLVGGVTIEDIRRGNGAPVQKGKKVQVYYEGRFKSNNKIFDKSTTGKGFEFIVGRGNVIKGWDVGVLGMRMGGKRRIVCPPEMAYGARGSPPAIPANATLIFDIELRNVH